MQSSATIAGILTLDHRIPTSDFWPLITALWSASQP